MWGELTLLAVILGLAVAMLGTEIRTTHDLIRTHPHWDRVMRDVAQHTPPR